VSDDSKIEWTDATWNCVTGCTKVSPGCDHCYAETFAERWRGIPGHHFENGFDITLRPERLEQPRHWKRPRRIFVNSMSDVFHEAVPDDFILQMFAIMAVTPHHQYQVLTKRHARMRSLLNRPQFADDLWALVWQLDGGLAWRRCYWPLRNVWLGISAEDQHWADIRIPALLQTPAAMRFISAEPLLGPVGLRPGEWIPPIGGGPRVSLAQPWETPGPSLDWVIVGGESGPGARRMTEGWARFLVEQCQDTGTAIFVKQLGSVLGRKLGAGPKGGDWDAWPEDLRVREFPAAAEVISA
jgi:protein gp37